MKTIELHRSITDSNDKDAERLRGELSRKGAFLINVMSSAGSGKTQLLLRIIKDISERISIGVMEADIASDVDAVVMEEAGASSIQAHTDGMCHMDAGMTSAAIDALGEEKLPELIFLENVGNLICPAEYDTGAHKNIALLSVTEGDDKPEKYPLVFQKSDALVITKKDVAGYTDFSFERVRDYVRFLNPDINIFEVSARTGEGMDSLERWILESVKGGAR